MTNSNHSIAQRLQSIDALRGIAVLAVIAIHSPHYAIGGWRNHPWFFPSFIMNYGYLGVHLFVMISGFCIHFRSAKDRRSTGEYAVNWIAFWKRRMWRLYPPYLAAIILSLTVDACTRGSCCGNEPIVRTWDLVTHLLLIHNLTSEYAFGLGNISFWSLGMEEQLYALYFCLLWFFRRQCQYPAVIAVCLVSLLWRVLAPDSGPNPTISSTTLGMWSLWPFAFWCYWALGAMSADALHGNIKLPQFCFSPLLAVVCCAIGIALNQNTLVLIGNTNLVVAKYAVTLVAVVHPAAEIFFAMSFFCLLNSCVSLEKIGLLMPRLTILAAVGRVSYSIYLVHVPSLKLFHNLFRIELSATGWPISVFSSFLVSLVAGVAFYWLIERHFQVTHPKLIS